MKESLEEVRRDLREMKKHLRVSAKVDVHSHLIEEMSERMDTGIVLVDTWMEKNVRAEGEVTLLRKRVEGQEIEIGELRARLAGAEKLLQERKSLYFQVKYICSCTSSCRFRRPSGDNCSCRCRPSGDTSNCRYRPSGSLTRCRQLSWYSRRRWSFR